MATATKTKKLTLVSPNKSLWVSLSTNEDDYNHQGGMRMVKRGLRVRFDNHFADVDDTPEMREQLADHAGYGRTFFFKDDPDAPPVPGGVGVVEGQLHGASRRDDLVPPTPEWDTTGARELRGLISSGRVDLQEALAWEGAHNAREQVLGALGRAIRAERGETEVVPGDEAPVGSEGHVRSLPADAGGIT